jgi:hypothetical protein
VEHAAVRLCNIQPDDNVLEVGFGPGVGLNEAFRMVKGNVKSSNFFFQDGRNTRLAFCVFCYRIQVLQT